MTIKVGNIYGEKVQYEDGIGCCIWHPLPNDPEPESGGLCWDFDAERIDDLIELLRQLKNAPAEPLGE